MRLKYIRFRDLISVIVLFFMLPISLICKPFLKKFWLICEDKNECRDNGYWFYLYMMENHKEQKVYYVINKKCSDYKKINKFDNVIRWGSFKHWLFYLCAEKNISSQKGSKPNAAVFYLFEVAIPILKTHRIFLQHGITKDNAPWLYYKNCKFDLFICSAKDEYEYILENFGYNDKNCALLGFSRFDNLNNELLDKDYILIMPSWREYIAREVATKNVNSIDYFKKTTYFKKWNELLNSKKLKELLEKTNKKIIFYPHRNMQKYISAFTTASNNIIIGSSNNYDVQELLKKCALLITDYSSIFFDFGYMLKPIIFYQFDYEEFRKNQYQEGYFDYNDNIFGKSYNNYLNVVIAINNYIQNNFEIDKENRELLQKFFLYNDNNNSKRIYDYVKNM